MNDQATDQNNASQDEGHLTLPKLAKEFEHLFGKVVLMYKTEPAFLLGVGMDMEDYYYIVWSFERKGNVWYSAVGHCEPYEGDDIAELQAIAEQEIKDMPETLQVLSDLGGKTEPYDSQVHEALCRQLQEEHYEAAVKRAQETFTDLDPNRVLH